MSGDHDDGPPPDGEDAKDRKGPYRDPPKKYRWRPGQSGNPGGRPPGSKNRPKEPSQEDYRKVIVEEGRRLMVISDASGPLTLTTAQAIRRKRGIVALKGSVRAMRDYLESYDKAEKELRREREALLLELGELKIDWHQTVESYRKRGLKPPKPLIDPDDVTVDPITYEVRFRGPAMAEETARWERYRDACERWLQQVEEQWDGASRRRRKRILEDRKLVEACLNAVHGALGGSREAIVIMEHLEADLALMFAE